MLPSPQPRHLAAVPSLGAVEYGNDAALIAAVLAGDARAAGRFHDHLRPVIEHALRRILRGRRGDFDDLVQVTFERVLRGLAEDRFEGRCALTTWAAAIAGHVALDALRRRLREERRMLPTTDTEQSEPTTSSEQRMVARAELLRLHAILSRMKPVLAETLVLHDVLGHGLDEVATLTRATPSAAQSRLFRARKELVRRAQRHFNAGAGA